MKNFFIFLIIVLSALHLKAQKNCASAAYLNQELTKDITLKNRMQEIEAFVNRSAVIATNRQGNISGRQIIKIPVVFHVLYNAAEENVREKGIIDQLNILNRDFRRNNADTANTPNSFLPVAADMEIEFYLAKSDPAGRSTSGIVRKYTQTKYWLSDDKMKFKSFYGDDGWDSKSYLNIWVCNLKDAMGYSVLPGCEPSKDGIVLAYEDITSIGTQTANNGRTLVHEVGHWLNLKHIWGDSFCGDDNIDDTPKQSNYTPGCPSGTRRSCGNTGAGDMYMNYMDFTDDGCMNLFTKGQKQRARSLFEPGGYRNSILSSTGLNVSDIVGAALPDYYPHWDEVKVYPNPATSTVNLYTEDDRWVGKEITIVDMTGRTVMKKAISSSIQQIDVKPLAPGVYFLRAEKEDEKAIKKFIKL